MWIFKWKDWVSGDSLRKGQEGKHFRETTEQKISIKDTITRQRCVPFTLHMDSVLHVSILDNPECFLGTELFYLVQLNVFSLLCNRNRLQMSEHYQALVLFNLVLKTNTSS